MPTLFFLKESMQISNIPIGELGALLDMEDIVSPMETCFNHSIVVKEDIPSEILIKIVKKAGYIHSAGPLIFNERWNNISNIQVSSHILEYFEENNLHIDIATFEKPKNLKTAELWLKKNSSILSAQIRTDKAFLGRMSFKQLLNQTKKNLKDNFLAKGIELNQKNKGTLFIYCDFCEEDNVRSILEYPGYNVNTHLICYHSIVRNIDPVINFKEKKPYWAGIFTTPHTLMTAMVNLSKPNPHKHILEPFTHTAGVPLQAARNRMKFDAIDIKDIAGGKDNVEFFTLNKENFSDLYDKIEELAYNKKAENTLKKIRDDAKNAVERPDRDNQYPILKWFPSNNPLYEELQNRLIFYVFRRYYYNVRAGMINETEIDFKKILSDELVEKARYYKEELNLLDDFDPETNVLQVGLHGDNSTLKDISTFKEADATSILPSYPSDHFDAIVTDPPYGAGIDEGDQQVLITLYDVFLSESIRILKNNGRLIFCTIWKSKTGKMIARNLCTDGVVKNLIGAAKAKGYHLQPALLNNKGNTHKYFLYNDEDKNYSVNIFYWKSQTFLDRGIIACRVIKPD